MTDYAPKLYHVHARKVRHMAWRTFQFVNVALFVWSAHTLVMSLVDLNESRVVLQEQAALNAKEK
jgi:hypothetical protein